MERSKRPYSTFKRPTSQPRRFMFYVRFRGEDGRYLPPVSSGQTSRAAACNWAEAKLKEGKLVLPGKRGVLLEAFTKDFWRYEGDYITRRLARGGHFSHTLAEIRAAQVQTWILPHFKGRALGGIRRHEIEAWVLELYRSSGLVPGTVNRILTNLKILMSEATRRGYAAADPAAGIEMLAENPLQRGILLPSEIAVLFAPDALAKVWMGERPFFAAAMLAVTGGLRAGEIRALRVMDVHEEFVTVCGAWEDGVGRKGAKWGSERLVPIPGRTAEELQAVVDALPYREPEDLVFLGASRGAPIGKHVLSDRFNEALGRIGIDEVQRRARRLVFHSTRHTFNSMMRGRIDSGKLYRITGHRQERTNLIYVHALPQDLVDVRKVQEEILEAPKPKKPLPESGVLE